MAARKNAAAVALGRRTSPAKAAAARANGTRGGRPRLPCVVCGRTDRPKLGHGRRWNYCTTCVMKRVTTAS
jgi:hypothetical protein